MPPATPEGLEQGNRVCQVSGLSLHPGYRHLQVGLSGDEQVGKADLALLHLLAHEGNVALRQSLCRGCGVETASVRL